MDEALGAKEGGASDPEEELRRSSEAQPRLPAQPFRIGCLGLDGALSCMLIGCLAARSETTGLTRQGLGLRYQQGALWLRRPGLRHWAREDGAGWLPGELLTSVRPGGFAPGESTSAALCLSEPLVQRYRGARAHIRWHRPPGGLRRRSELGIWRPQLSGHPLLLPVSYPVSDRGRCRWR